VFAGEFRPPPISLSPFGPDQSSVGLDAVGGRRPTRSERRSAQTRDGTFPQFPWPQTHRPRSHSCPLLADKVIGVAATELSRPGGGVVWSARLRAVTRRANPPHISQTVRHHGGFLPCRPVLGPVALRKATCGSLRVATVHTSVQGRQPAHSLKSSPCGSYLARANMIDLTESELSFLRKLEKDSVPLALQGNLSLLQIDRLVADCSWPAAP
jgi:hypothetical protein